MRGRENKELTGRGKRARDDKCEGRGIEMTIRKKESEREQKQRKSE